MSANTGRPPSARTVFAVELKVSGEVTTSLPSPTPAAAYAQCSAAVPLATTTAWAAPQAAASSPSNASVSGPVVRKSERRARTTAATSSSSMSCRP